MKIGVKYCGGCNSRYDRTDVLSKLKKYLGDGHDIEVATEGIIYDIVIILCGCTSACASHQKLQAKYEKVCITSESDSIKLFNIIDKVKIMLKGEC